MADAQQVHRRRRPLVVQHSFGELGSGGPIGALSRVLDSKLTEKYEFVSMHQDRATGGLDLPRLRAWRDMLGELQPDLVHVRGLGNEGLHGVLAARAAGCRSILVSVHGTVRDLTHKRSFKEHVLVTAAEPLTLRLATHVTTVCEYAASRPFVKRHADKFVGPIVNGVWPWVAEPRVGSDKRRELGVSDSAVVLIVVGRLTWDKGHRDLAAALRQIPETIRQGIVLLVAGDGPDRDGIILDYSGAGVDFRMLGRRSDVDELLAASDLFVFPTLHENLSNALLEAMAAGVPAVATAVGGNVEVLARGGGRLVQVKDPRALSKGIVELCLAPRLRSALGAEARRVVESHYSVDAMCRSLDDVYEQVLGEAR